MHRLFRLVAFLFICAATVCLSVQPASSAPGPSLQQLVSHQPLGLSGPETALDTRRKNVLNAKLTWHRVIGENASYPTPNAQLNADHHEYYYQARAGAIFGLVDMGELSNSRLDEANKLLRYEMLGKWPITMQGQLTGDNKAGWNHRTRTLGMRLYMMYSQWMDADILAEYHKRMDWMIRDAYNSSSENIKWTNNSSYFLAHEVRAKTNTSTFTNVKNWVISQLKRHGNGGFHEWGSLYGEWSLIAIQNLAEFAQDTEVQKRAEMVLDYSVAREAMQSVQSGFASPAVRRYPHWSTTASPEVQSNRMSVYFGGAAIDKNTWVDFALSNYRPLISAQGLRNHSGTFEAKYADDTSDNKKWKAKIYRTDAFSMASHMQGDSRTYYQIPSGGTHDIIGCIVHSAKHPGSKVVPYGYRPLTPPKKRRNMTERYFSYKNVAFVNHGGTTRAVWAGGGTFPNVPIRLFVSKYFGTRQIDSGWVFCNDGTTYVGWCPTIGAPRVDPESSLFSDPSKNGFWYQSDYGGNDFGEIGVLEVGDASMYGSFAQFKSNILSRNGRVRSVGDVVTYTHSDGTVLKMFPNKVQVNGVDWSPAGFPDMDAPGLTPTKITYGGANITFNWDGGSTSGTVSRMPTNMNFGNVQPPVVQYDAVGFVYPPNGNNIGGWAYDHESTTTTVRVIVESSPVHAAPKILGTISADNNLSASQESAISTHIQNNLGVTPPAGRNFGWSEDWEQWLLNHPDTTQSGTYTLRFVCLDKQDNRHKTLVDSTTSSNMFDINVTVETNDAPTAPTDLYVGSLEAQTGTNGDPVVDIGLAPYFSAVYHDPDVADQAGSFYIQVSTDPTWATTTHWDSGVISFTNPVTDGNRCEDIAYAGTALDYSTRYYWRMIFVDEDGLWGAVHSEVVSFTTEDLPVTNTPPGAPTDLYVHSDDASLGIAGTVATPATDVDLSPVFSAVFNDDDAGDTSGLIRLQVATDELFASGTVWLVPEEGLAIASCTEGQRCADIAYDGDPLDADTTYFWRMIFQDANGAWSAISPTGAFKTVAAPATGGSGSGGGGGGGCAVGGSTVPWTNTLPWLLIGVVLILSRRRS